jgi:predicted aspartyl protease
MNARSSSWRWRAAAAVCLSVMPAIAAEVALRQTAAGGILLPVSVNGVSLTFVLDTGAEQTLLARRAFATLPGMPGLRGPTRAQAAGGAIELQSSVVREIRVGDFVRQEVPVAVMDLRPLQEQMGAKFDGVLGVDFLRGQDVTLDLRAGRLRLESAYGQPSGAPFSGDGGGLIRFSARVDGTDIIAVLDTGAMHSIMNWPAARALGIASGDPRLTPVDGVTGIDGRPLHVFVCRFDELQIDRARYASPKLRIADLPGFGAMGLAGRPAMLVGADLVRGHTVVISFAARTIRVN